MQMHNMNILGQLEDAIPFRHWDDNCTCPGGFRDMTRRLPKHLPRHWSRHWPHCGVSPIYASVAVDLGFPNRPILYFTTEMTGDADASPD
jgi:hypothetical protein